MGIAEMIGVEKRGEFFLSPFGRQKEEDATLPGLGRGFSRVTAGFSSSDGEFRLPLVLAQASPIFHSSCEGKLGIALE